MTIAEIKSQLTIGEVLSHYNLESNRNGMLSCPFHEDDKASMKVCEVKNLDVIDFIMKKENSTKHQAIIKAKSLCNHQVDLFSKSPTKMTNELSSNPSNSFKRYHKSIHQHKLAQEYCEMRCLDWRVLEVGYKSRKTSEKWGCEFIWSWNNWQFSFLSA